MICLSWMMIKRISNIVERKISFEYMHGVSYFTETVLVMRFHEQTFSALRPECLCIKRPV